MELKYDFAPQLHVMCLCSSKITPIWKPQVNGLNDVFFPEWQAICWLAFCWLHFIKVPRAHRPCLKTASSLSAALESIHYFPFTYYFWGCFIVNYHSHYASTQQYRKEKCWCRRGKNLCVCFNVKAAGRLREAEMRSASRITLRTNTNIYPLWLLIPRSLFRPNWIGGRRKTKQKKAPHGC